VDLFFQDQFIYLLVRNILSQQSSGFGPNMEWEGEHRKEKKEKQ
jgi:hypothetical protein